MIGDSFYSDKLNHGHIYLKNVPWEHNTLCASRFHDSWEWIMAVVSKIENLGYNVEIKGISCKIYPVLSDESIVQLVLGNKSKKKELVYSAILEFIQFFNEKKIKQP